MFNPFVHLLVTIAILLGSGGVEAIRVLRTFHTYSAVKEPVLGELLINASNPQLRRQIPYPVMLLRSYRASVIGTRLPNSSASRLLKRPNLHIAAAQIAVQRSLANPWITRDLVGA